MALLQSNYLPWRGYFDFMMKCDEFIIYDSCQYTVNDWRNRNQVKTVDGVRWITIPILTKGRTGQRIVDAEVADHKWIRAHPAMLAAVLGSAPWGKDVITLLGESYDAVRSTRWLHEINVQFLASIHSYLGCGCRLGEDSEYTAGLSDALSPSARVAEIVRRAGGTTYLTGPRGLAYLDEIDFIERGIEIEVLDYSTLTRYPQQHGEFVDNLSIVDLLANVGSAAAAFLTSSPRDLKAMDGDGGDGGDVRRRS